MEIKDGLGERLRRLRLERGMTQARLAEPYSSAFVSQIEAGRKLPSESALTLFAKKLGVSVAELATGRLARGEVEIAEGLRAGWHALYLGRFAAARKAFRSAERLARKGPHHDLVAKALVGQAWCSERSGQTADALRLFREAFELFREHLPPPAAVEAVAGLARCHQMRGEAALALYLLERYQAELEEQHLGDPAAVMRVHASLVWPYLELGLQDKAYEAARRALRLQSRVEVPEEIASMHLNVARALLARGEVDSAVQSLDKAQEIYRDLNWQTEVARAEMARGILLVAEDRLSEGRSHLSSALETFRAVGFVREESRTLNELARLDRLAGDVASAKDRASQALELLAETEALPEQALAHRELGLCLSASDPKAAERHLRAAIDLYETCGEVDHAADAYRLLGDLLESARSNSGVVAYRAGLALISKRIDRND